MHIDSKAAKEQYKRGIMPKGGEAMKCPLFIREVEATFTRNKFELSNCLGDKCAWYDEKLKGCAILTIAKMSMCLNALATEVVDKMPHELQFRR